MSCILIYFWRGHIFCLHLDFPCSRDIYEYQHGRPVSDGQDLYLCVYINLLLYSIFNQNQCYCMQCSVYKPTVKTLLRSLCSVTLDNTSHSICIYIYIYIYVVPRTEVVVNLSTFSTSICRLSGFYPPFLIHNALHCSSLPSSLSLSLSLSLFLRYPIPFS